MKTMIRTEWTIAECPDVRDEDLMSDLLDETQEIDITPLKLEDLED